MNLTRRNLGAALAVGLGLGVAGCGSGADDKGQTVHIGYTADFSGAAAFAVAQKQGLFTKQGLKPELKPFTNGPLQIQAFGSKNLDFGYIGPGALWLPASGKAKVVAINQLGLADHVIAQPGKSIKTLADLQGRKVAVPQGTSGEMILRLALKRAGMTVSDVDMVNMDASTVVSAFASGSVDAAAIWYPLIDTIAKRKPNFVDLASDKAFYPKMTFPNAFVASNDLVAKKPALVKKFLRVVQQANDWIVAHPRQAEQVTAQFLKVPADQLAAATKYVKLLPTKQLVADSKDGTVDKWLDALAAVFADMGKVKDPAPAKEFYTADLYASAAG
jgi:NitT/TauT family transport system substrate-binding protein